MKRILCLLLCLTLLGTSVAFAADTTLPELFRIQVITGGYGVRGKASITASGTAPWLDVLLPFTASEIQIRAIGMQQGALSQYSEGADNWQLRLYVEDSNGKAAGTTWLYGQDDAIFLSSELLPDTVLTLPDGGVHLLYDLIRQDYAGVFLGLDPLDMTSGGVNGNLSAYDAIRKVLGVPEEEWETEWEPVLQKYYVDLDMWLTGYGSVSELSGSKGSMTMSVCYTIPSADLKEKAKAVISQMLYDSELQELLLPYVTLEQRVLYLNPALLYYYDACIDALALGGDVILSREMSALGENISTSVSLPLPQLPETLTAPVNQALTGLFALPYEDAMSGMNRIVIAQAGEECSVTLSGSLRTIALSIDESATNAESANLSGFLRITPALGNDEPPLCAAFSYKTTHTVYEDDDYFSHDTSTLSLTLEPSLDLISESDPFRSKYVDFTPVNLSLTVDYRNQSYNNYSPTQVNISAAIAVKDANVTLDLVLRTTNMWDHADLPTEGAENLAELTDARKEELLAELIVNAVRTMSSLNAPAAPTATPVPEATAAPATDVPDEAAPTAVPPMGE